MHPALGADEVAAVRVAVWEALDGRCLLRDELADAVVERVGPTPRERLRSGFAFFLSDLCQGPPQGRGSRCVRPDQWIASWAEMDEHEALREVCRRFLRTYSPARPVDFFEWFGTAAFRMAEARALFDELAGELDEIGGDGRAYFVLAGDRWFSPLSAQARLLPEYDVYVMGFRERDQLVPEPVRGLIASRGRGRYEGPAATRPSCSWTGPPRACGSGRGAADGSSCRCDWLAGVGNVARTELAHEAERFGAFLGLEPALSVGSG